jgi:hypothetical protein
MRLWTLILLLTLAATGPVFADCESGIAALAPKLATVTDPQLRALLESDLRHAQSELWEFDEAECAGFLQHAENLLKTGP